MLADPRNPTLIRAFDYVQHHKSKHDATKLLSVIPEQLQPDIDLIVALLLSTQVKQERWEDGAPLALERIYRHCLLTFSFENLLKNANQDPQKALDLLYIYLMLGVVPRQRVVKFEALVSKPIDIPLNDLDVNVLRNLSCMWLHDFMRLLHTESPGSEYKELLEIMWPYIRDGSEVVVDMQSKTMMLTISQDANELGDWLQEYSESAVFAKFFPDARVQCQHAKYVEDLKMQDAVSLLNRCVPGGEEITRNLQSLPDTARAPFLKKNGVALTSLQLKAIKFIYHCSRRRFTDSSFVTVHKEGSVILTSTCFNNKKLYRRLNINVWQHVWQFGGGILGNGTGAGKSLTVIASLVETTLVVVPNILVDQWATELAKHTTLGLVPSEDKPYALVFEEASDLPKKWPTCLRQPLVIIIGRRCLSCKAWSRHPYVFQRLFVDEAHNINSSTKTFKLIQDVKCATRWMVTATPFRNFVNILGLLKWTTVFAKCFKGEMTFRDGVSIAAGHTIMEKNELNNVEIQREILFAETTPEEDNFFTKVACLLANNKYSPYFLRICRILERISAGGPINSAVLFEVLTSYCDGPKGKKRRVKALEPTGEVASQPAFAGKADDCCVCLDKFDDPQQLSCGHVFCERCLEAVAGIMHKCPTCRAAFTDPLKVFIPLWTVKDKAKKTPEKQKEEKKEDDYFTQRGYASVLKYVHVGADLLLQGKVEAFRKYFGKWQEDRGSKLVIYVKRELVALPYIDIVRESGLSFITVGLHKDTDKEAMRKIGCFRKGATNARVIFLTLKYSTGFDFNMASHHCTMDSDLDIAKMIQAQGRCIRLGQTNDVVSFTLFAYKYTMDHFVHDFAHLGTISESDRSRSLLNVFLCARAPNSFYLKMREFWHIVAPPEFRDTFKLGTQGAYHYTINGVVGIDRSTGEISMTPGQPPACYRPNFTLNNYNNHDQQKFINTSFCKSLERCFNY
jgi:hypothetical protein